MTWYDKPQGRLQLRLKMGKYIEWANSSRKHFTVPTYCNSYMQTT